MESVDSVFNFATISAEAGADLGAVKSCQGKTAVPAPPERDSPRLSTTSRDILGVRSSDIWRIVCEKLGWEMQ
jgi:hypothetical protein